jgi:pimeloyl-ACP methyl ester carboxylesterase
MVGMVGAVFRVLTVLAATTSVALAAPPKPARWETIGPDIAAMPAPTTHGAIDVAGAHIYYATYGKPDGDPLILLHGGLGNSEQWGDQLPALADKFHIIAIDSRGQGRSTLAKAKMTYDLMASDVVAVMDQLDIKHASFVGWSDGGEVALLLGIHYASRVDKLFVLGVNYDSSGSKPRGSRSPTFQAYSVRCKQDFVRLTKPANPARAWDELVDGVLPLWQNPMSITKDQLTTIKAPTLIADGDHDEVIVLDQEREMAKLIPAGQLVVWPDTSHFAMWQAPDDVNAAILAFLVPAPAPAK